MNVVWLMSMVWETHDLKATNNARCKCKAIFSSWHSTIVSTVLKTIHSQLSASHNVNQKCKVWTWEHTEFLPIVSTRIILSSVQKIELIAGTTVDMSVPSWYEDSAAYLILNFFSPHILTSEMFSRTPHDTLVKSDWKVKSQRLILT